MTPIGFTLSPDVEAGYVYYRTRDGQRLRSRDVALLDKRLIVFPVGENTDHDPHVVIDVLPDDSIFGVELLGYDEATIALFRAALKEYGLDEPAGMAEAIERRATVRR